MTYCQHQTICGPGILQKTLGVSFAVGQQTLSISCLHAEQHWRTEDIGGDMTRSWAGRDCGKPGCSQKEEDSSADKANINQLHEGGRLSYKQSQINRTPDHSKRLGSPGWFEETTEIPSGSSQHKTTPRYLDAVKNDKIDCSSGAEGAMGRKNGRSTLW